MNYNNGPLVDVSVDIAAASHHILLCKLVDGEKLWAEADADARGERAAAAAAVAAAEGQWTQLTRVHPVTEHRINHCN